MDIARGHCLADADPPRQSHVLSISRRGGYHRIAYTDWGDENPVRVAVCVHGLTRQGRDFDALARALAGRGWRVVCPDLVGRGRSDWLPDPDEYALPQYAMDLTVPLARLRLRARPARRRADRDRRRLARGLVGVTGTFAACQPAPKRDLLAEWGPGAGVLFST